MKVYYDDSYAGSGKTGQAIKEMVKAKRKTLFFTERIESFDELERRINKQAGIDGTAPIIDKVYSAQTDRLGSVSRQIEALPERHQHHDHVIVIATHAGMLRSDFSSFRDWHVIVDEVPQFVDYEEKRTHLDAAFFKTHYELEAVTGAWCFVKPTPAGSALSVTDVLADQSHDHLAVFHRRVLEASSESSNRCVLVNMPSWEAMADRKVQWCWASAFTLKELEHFETVTVLGNRFRSDVGALISQKMGLNDIEWEPLPRPSMQRFFQFRPVHISYFSETRSASRYLFESEAGQVMLREIGARLAKELNGFGHIWTANERDTLAARLPRDGLRAVDRNVLRTGIGSQRPVGVVGTHVFDAVDHRSSSDQC